MPQNEAIPYSEYVDVPLGNGDEVRGSNTTSSSDYERQIRDILASHTGSREVFLTVEQEHELARTITDGHAAQEERIKLEERIGKLKILPPKLEKSYFAVLARIRAGREAERTLIECNLRLSAYLARASMNILPPGDQEAISSDTKAGARRRALGSSGLPWLPKDFTSLKSRHAVLDDRIQIANIGLMNAARKFKPGMTGRNGEVASFMSFASPVIKSEITKFVKVDEKPVRVSMGVADDIFKAYNDDGERFTPEERERLLAWDQLSDTIPLDDLYFDGAIDEEKEQDDDIVPPLWAGEVIPSVNLEDPAEEVFDTMRADAINEVFQTLSEREAGVLRLRFGLVDGTTRTLDEIGAVYGVTRERVRQIESHALGKLRHPSRGQLLAPYKTIAETGDLPMRSGDVVKTQRTLGYSTVKLVVAPAEPDEPTPRPDVEERWQAYPGEAWDEPVRATPEQLQAERDTIAQKFKDALFNASLYTFQKSFTEEVRSPYPKLLVEQIETTFDKVDRGLTPQHIADFWNNELVGFLGHLDEKLGDDVDVDRVTQLLSRLLAGRMGDNDQVELRIPEVLDGKLGYVGAWLSHGIVRVTGNLGDHAGHGMNTLGHLQIDGNVGHYAGNRMSGNARLEIDGNTGDYLGAAMSGSSSLLVNGDAGKYCGYRVKSPNVMIEVLGEAGDNLAAQARGAVISVAGTTIPLN